MIVHCTYTHTHIRSNIPTSVALSFLNYVNCLGWHGMGYTYVRINRKADMSYILHYINETGQDNKNQISTDEAFYIILTENFPNLL